MSGPTSATDLPKSTVVFYPLLLQVNGGNNLTVGLASTKDVGAEAVSNPDTALVKQIQALAEQRWKREGIGLESLYDSWASQVLGTGEGIYDKLNNRQRLAKAGSEGSSKPFSVLNYIHEDKVSGHLSTFKFLGSENTPAMQQELAERYLGGSATSDDVNIMPPSHFAQHKCRLATDEELDAFIDARRSTFAGSDYRPLKPSEIRRQRD